MSLYQAKGLLIALVTFLGSLAMPASAKASSANLSVTSGIAPLDLQGTGIAPLNNERSQIICISDIHLGANDLYTECRQNRGALVNFLNQVRLSPNVKELVIVGDLFDEWFIPASTDTFNGKTQLDFVCSIAANNKPVFDAFNSIITDGKIKVTYIPGNHDLLITKEDVESVLPGISQARDVRGLGAYSPDAHPEIIIEHGHRYNFFCAPDPISNKSIAPGSILPPGYFFTRIATTSVVEKKPAAGGTIPQVTPNKLGESQTLAFVYWNVWKTLMTALPVKEGFDQKIIKTKIDGFTATYSINDFMPFQLKDGGFIDLKVYKGIQDTWNERQLLNKVAVNIPAYEAITKADSAGETDQQALTQYFTNKNSQKRIVVFGHTHEARIIPSENLKGQKTIYANSGTWIDKNTFPTMTFVVITPQKSGGSVQEFVNLYKYSQTGQITPLATQSL
ncbi:MAG: metallophosphoesterase [Chlorobiaceae bacterium]